MSNIETIIRIAKSRVGIKEVPAGSNNVDCNTWYYGREVHDGDRGNATYPWCMTNVQYIFHLAGLSHLLTKTASCSTLAKWFKDQKRFYRTPQVGDLVFYNFSHPKYLADHVGIVVQIKSSNSIVAIEGNTSQTSQDNGGAVMLRGRSTRIVGYGRPNYDTKINTTKIKRKNLKLGSVGADVQYLHKKLNALHYGVFEENNKFNTLTQLCVMDFQSNHNLVVDGEVGPATWSALG